MKSSTRNQFIGRICNIQKGNDTCLVSIDCLGMTISAMISNFSLENLKLDIGKQVCAMVKAPSITIMTDLEPMKLSTENVIPGIVSQIQEGAVNSVVTLKITETINISATITMYSCEFLALKETQPAVAVFNANQVILGVL